MQNRIFRKISLERLSSPEQLDQVMQVTTSRAWIALAAIALLLTTAIAWSMAGTIADKVSGRGILLRTGGVLEIVANSSGRVLDVAVEVGDSVREGQVIARLTQPELFDRLAGARAVLETLEREQAEALAASHREVTLQERSIQQQRTNLEQSIAAWEESLRWLSERITSQEQLLGQGLVTKATLLNTRQQYDQTKERIRAGRSEIVQLDVRALGVANQMRERVRASELKVEQAMAEVEQLERDLTATTQIVSPYTGRILEVMAEAGQIVGRGEAVMSLDLQGEAIQDLVAIIYVPAVQGKMIKPGMQIQIAPSTVRQEEYGVMLGTVTFVSGFPATPRGMMRVLKNEQLISELSGGAAPFEVHAALTVDPGTASRYRWSSSKGPPIQIESGTIAGATVTVDEQPPLALVIPLLRRWTGI